MGLMIGGVSARDLILDGHSVPLYEGGNPPVKVWPTEPRVVTIRRSTIIGQWDRGSATGDTSLIQEWVGGNVVRFVADVTCDRNVYSGDSMVVQPAGTVLRAGVDITPAGAPNVYTFTEVL